MAATLAGAPPKKCVHCHRCIDSIQKHIVPRAPEEPLELAAPLA
jgi:hypothetical protein